MKTGAYLWQYFAEIFSDEKFVQRNQNTHFMSINIFQQILPFMR